MQPQVQQQQQQQQQRAAVRRKALSSLPLQMAVYFGGWYSALFAAATFVLIVVKAALMPFSASSVAWELFFVAMFAAVESVRLFICESLPPGQLRDSELIALRPQCPRATRRNKWGRSFGRSRSRCPWCSCSSTFCSCRPTCESCPILQFSQLA